MKPVSKPSDMYNYQVAAYLKTSVVASHIPGPPLKNLDFNVVPKSIPNENSYLNVEILLDIVISGSEYEFLCECKHHQEPRPLTPNSTEVKDSVLEFIAAEKYRIGHIKRDGIFYLLITNCPTATLRKRIGKMRTASDKEIILYSDRLKKRAQKKWTSFDPKIKIKSEWIRNVLARMVLVEIDRGRLAQSSKNPAYEQELRKIMDQVSRVNPALIPLEYRIRNTIRFTVGDTEEKYEGLSKNGYFVEISKAIVDQVISCKRILGEHFIKATIEELPFVKRCEILHHRDMSPEKATGIVIEALNDLIEQNFGRITFFIVMNPGTYDVYYADLEWLYDIVTKATNTRGFYMITTIAEQLPLVVSKFILASLVRETMRMYAGIIAKTDVMDFSGMK